MPPLIPTLPKSLQAVLLSLGISLAILSGGSAPLHAQIPAPGTVPRDLWVTFRYLSGNGSLITAQVVEKLDNAVRCKVGSQYEVIPAEWLIPADLAKLGFRAPAATSPPSPSPSPSVATAPAASTSTSPAPPSAPAAESPSTPLTDATHYRGHSIQQIYAYGLKLGADADFRLVRSADMTPAERQRYGVSEPAEAERLEREATTIVYGENMNVDLEQFRRLLSQDSTPDPSRPTPAAAASPLESPSPITSAPADRPAARTIDSADRQKRRWQAQAAWYHQASSHLSPTAPPPHP